MELRHLIYFEAVARHQHVSRAAEELSIAQPAITKQIRDLERELEGGPLFERVGRNLRLTEAGRTLLLHARVILAQAAMLRAEMRERGALRRGRVTLGTPPTIGERLLPDALAAFYRRYPELEICVHEGSTKELLRLLEDGQLDIAIVTLPVARRGLLATPLFTEELVLAVALDHRLAGQSAVSFAELADEPFLLYPPGYEMREATLAACKQAGFTPRVVLDGGAVDMLLRLAEANLGVAVMPLLAVVGHERLAVLRISDRSLRRTMALVIRDSSAVTPASLALHAFLEERLTRVAGADRKE
jgi:DNA-binding transcriptional LysR family regulator